MSSMKKIFFSIFITIIFINFAKADDLKSLGKFKDWESFLVIQEGNKV